MKVDKWREMNDVELRAKLKESKTQQMHLRFNKATRGVDDPTVFKKIRKDVARIKTILNERRIYEKWKKMKENEGGS